MQIDGGAGHQLEKAVPDVLGRFLLVVPVRVGSGRADFRGVDAAEPAFELVHGAVYHNGESGAVSVVDVDAFGTDGLPLEAEYWRVLIGALLKLLHVLYMAIDYYFRNRKNILP